MADDCPSMISVAMRATLLPGYGPEDLPAEMRPIAGEDAKLKVTKAGEIGHEQPDMGLYDTLCEILREADQHGVPAPLLLTAPTDGRYFARLGIQSHGYQPLNLPPDVDTAKLSHAPDERMPVEALESGATAIYKALQRFGSSSPAC